MTTRTILAITVSAILLFTNCKKNKNEVVPESNAGNKKNNPMPINDITMGSMSLSSEYANRILLGHSYSRGFFRSSDGSGGNVSVNTFDYSIDIVGMFIFDGIASGLSAGTITINDSLVPWLAKEKYYNNDYQLITTPTLNYNLLSNAYIKGTGSVGVEAFELDILKPLCDTIAIVEPNIIYERAIGITLNLMQPIVGADSIIATISTSNKLLQEKSINKSVAFGITDINFTSTELNALFADSSASISISAYKNSFPANIGTRKTHVLGIRTNQYLIILK